MRKQILCWFGAFWAATLLAWLTAGWFINGVVRWEYDPALAMHVRPAGWAMRWRSEGFASTHFGTLDVSGIADAAASPGGRVLIWGDSFVEGYQLADELKLPQQFTRLAGEAGAALTGIGVARSGRALGDTYALMPKYEAKLAPVAHAIVLAQIEDMEPDGVVFKEAPAYAFAARPEITEEYALASRWLSRLRMECFIVPARDRARAIAQQGGLRWLPERKHAPPRRKGPEPAPTPASVREDQPPAWEFALAQLRMRTQKPLYLVYAPEVPVLHKGRRDEVDLDGHEAAALEAIAARHGIVWVDCRPGFIAQARATREYPRGYANGELTQGHMNATGHRLAAEALLHAMKARGDAVHPN